MNPKVIEVVHAQAQKFGVTTDAVLGRDATRRASAARRAVWAALHTRYPGGEFPIPVLAKLFDRQENVVRAGIHMHERKLLSWPRAGQGPVQIEGSNATFIMQRRLRALRARYKKLSPRDPLRATVRAECARLKNRLLELGESTS